MEKETEIECLQYLIKKFDYDPKEILSFLISQMLYGMMSCPEEITKKEFLEIMSECWDDRKNSMKKGDKQ